MRGGPGSGLFSLTLAKPSALCLANACGKLVEKVVAGRLFFFFFFFFGGGGV